MSTAILLTYLMYDESEINDPTLTSTSAMVQAETGTTHQLLLTTPNQQSTDTAAISCIITTDSVTPAKINKNKI